jgi:hypothetical protein
MRLKSDAKRRSVNEVGEGDYLLTTTGDWHIITENPYHGKPQEPRGNFLIKYDGGMVEEPGIQRFAKATDFESEYVELSLDYQQIPIADVGKFIQDMHPWVQAGFDLRVEFSFPEADGWLTRPRFAGGPSVQFKLLVREDQFEKAKESIVEAKVPAHS